MHSLELIKGYKSAYTPIGEDAKIISYYIRNNKETGSLDPEPMFIIMDPFQAVNQLQSINTLEKFLSEKKDREYVKLYSDFLVKWDIQQPHFSHFGKAFVFDNIKTVINLFLTLKPNYITFDLTKDCSVFFQALVNDKNIYLELYFADDIEGNVEAIANIYQNGECIFAYGSTIEDTFSKVTSLVKKHSLLYEPTQPTYGISQSAFTSTKL